MTQYYPKVMQAHIKDKVINLKLDFRLKMVSLKKVKCVGKDCGYLPAVSPGKFRSMFPASTLDVKKRNEGRCPYCTQTVVEYETLAYKLYFTYDRRIKIELFMNDLFTYSLVDELGRAQRSLSFKATKSKFYEKNLSMKFCFFERYEEVVNILKTIKVRERDEKEKKMRNKVQTTLKVLHIPTREELEKLHEDYKKRKLIEAI